MKKLYILLLFIIFTNSLTSMQIQEEKVEKILDLPNEILDCIIKQTIEKDFLETLNNWNSLFEEAPKPDLILIKNLGQSCKIFHALCKDNLILKENLRLFNKLKKRRVKQLLNSLKNKSLEEYNGVPREELNIKLTNSLNIILNIQNSKEELEKRLKLIFAGADIDTQNNLGYTPLMLAVMFKHKEVIKILLNSGANIDAKDNNQVTALIKAAAWGNKAIVKMLINKNANINAQDSSRYTALMWAVTRGRKEIVEMLLNTKKADVNVQDNNGDNALTLTIKCSQVEIKNMIEMYEARRHA